MSPLLMLLLDDNDVDDDVKYFPFNSVPAISIFHPCVLHLSSLPSPAYDTMRYTICTFTCTQKLTYSQPNLPHGTNEQKE